MLWIHSSEAFARMTLTYGYEQPASASPPQPGAPVAAPPTDQQPPERATPTLGRGCRAGHPRALPVRGCRSPSPVIWQLQHRQSLHLFWTGAKGESKRVAQPAPASRCAEDRASSPSAPNSSPAQSDHRTANRRRSRQRHSSTWLLSGQLLLPLVLYRSSCGCNGAPPSDGQRDVIGAKSSEGVFTASRQQRCALPLRSVKQ